LLIFNGSLINLGDEQCVMSTRTIEDKSLHSTERATITEPFHAHIGVVGEQDVGKTTIATAIATRLRGEARVRVLSEDPTVPTEGGVDGAGVLPAWTVTDASGGVSAFETCVGNLDCALLVATPDGLDEIGPYRRVAREAGTDLRLVVNRVRERDRERLRAFDGPPIGAYVRKSVSVRGMIENDVGAVDARASEMIIVRALRAESVDPETGIAALGSERIVNIEIEAESDAEAIVQEIRERGHRAAYYRCTCGCHDGHVLAASTPASSD
jgi:hypothetical protein